MAARTVASFLLFITLASSSTATQSASARDLHPEDVSVLRAVLDGLILPELARFGDRVPAPMLLVEDQTMAFAAGIPDRWQAFLKPDAKTRWAGLIPEDMRRRRIIDSFESRNARPNELPELGPSASARVAKERIAEVLQQYSDRPVVVARFSLPGYSPDGFAMVVAAYGCGNLCGASWLIILDNSTGSWRFANSHPLSIS